jgi:hypothetical protein
MKFFCMAHGLCLGMRLVVVGEYGCSTEGLKDDVGWRGFVDVYIVYIGFWGGFGAHWRAKVCLWLSVFLCAF